MNKVRMNDYNENDNDMKKEVREQTEVLQKKRKKIVKGKSH